MTAVPRARQIRQLIINLLLFLSIPPKHTKAKAMQMYVSCFYLFFQWRDVGAFIPSHWVSNQSLISQFVGADGRTDDEDASAELIGSDIEIKVEQQQTALKNQYPQPTDQSMMHQQPPTPPMSQNSSPMPQNLTNAMMVNSSRPQYAHQSRPMPPPSYDMPYVQSVQQQSAYRMHVSTNLLYVEIAICN
jgi:hypothetical protein